MTDPSPPMKLSLDVDKPPSGKAFQPGDLVSGRVELQLPAGLHVPDIQIAFQGTAKISLKPGFDAVNQVADTHKQETSRLFSIHKTLSPTRAWKTDASLQTYSAVFSIPFPQYAQCCSSPASSSSSSSSSKPSCNLPPSSRISCAGLKVTFAYTVTALCRRPSGRQSRFNLLSYIQRNLSACQVLQFVPPVDDQLQASDDPTAAVPPSSTSPTLYVRPNAPLAGSQPIQRQQPSRQQGQPAPSLLSSRSPVPSRAASVSSASSSLSAGSVGSASSVSDASSLASRASSVSDSPPLYSPRNTTADCPKIVRSTAYLDTSNFSIDVPSRQRPQQRQYPYSTGDGGAPACLPAYTPSMTLEAVMPNLPVVTPGQPLPLSVFILTPQPLLAACAAPAANSRAKTNHLVLRTMDVRLRRTTYARIGAAMRADEASWPLWSYKGNALIETEKFNAASMLRWDRMSGIPAAATPGFWSCSVSRTYSLEISMGVSTQAAPGNVEHAATAIRVMVSEPPPAYILEE